MVVRTKIKQTEEDVLEFDDEPKSIYPKNLELPYRIPKKRGRRAKFDPITNSFETYMESFNE